MPLRFVLSALALIILSTAHADEAGPVAIRGFLTAYCVECHGPEKQKGDRRYDQLELPATKVDTLLELQDAIDQLNLGEMPPKKAKQPSTVEQEKFLEQMTAAVAQGHATLSSTGGDAVLRRLNRREYLNTISDLFAVNMGAFDPTATFPRDQTAEHMDNLGDVLRTSGYLLDQYIEAADAIVEKAFAVTERAPEQTWKFDDNFKQQDELSYSHGRVFKYRYLCVYECMDSENHEGGYAPINGFQKGVPVDGFYEIKVLAHAMNRHHPYDPLIFQTDPEEPFRLGIVPGDAKVGLLHHPQPLQPILAEATMRDGEPEWYTFKVWLDAGHTPRFVFPNGMRNCRQAFSKLASKYKDHWPKSDPYKGGIVDARRIVLQHGKMPHIRIHEVQIRGPIYDQWPPASQRAILGAKPFGPTRTRSLLAAFASRAYRRPATSAEVDRLLAVVAARRAEGQDELTAFKDGLKAAICSPAFLYLQQPDSKARAKETGRLDSYALASRLSYFLWATMPDAELLKTAASGKLTQPEVLLAQTRRMLASPRSDSFIAGFLDSWLNLRSLGDMPPDRDLFGIYYTKDFQHAFKRETHLFTRDLIERDASILNFVDSDYSFLNKPLAELYGLGDAVPSSEAHVFRRVALNNSNRGGLLGQGSVLTVTANGIETSPVVRGIWMLENILGTPPPPPPDDVPVIDPDVRGSKSIRELLSKHRESPNCYGCHQKIDPLGFALENFNPIGQWRTSYGKGKEIDPAGELPSGQSFTDIASLKTILMERKELFARMLTERLLTYACGRRVEALDQPVVRKIVGDLPQQDYGFRSLIEAVVLSEPFRTK